MLPKILYYLADKNDFWRLATDGTIQPSHQCHPRYFASLQDAVAHQCGGLLVVSVPTVETIPGAPVGTRIEDAIAADEVILGLSR